MNQEAHEVPDHHQYRMVMLYVDTAVFFVSSLDFYIDLLIKEREQINADPHFSNFITEETRREFLVGRDLEQARRIKEWLDGEVSKKKDHGDIWIAPDHWTVRFLKSVGLLYLGFIKGRRNNLASQPNISSNTLAAIDREITKREEMLTVSGIFSRATILPLLVDQQISMEKTSDVVEDSPRSIAKISRPAPVVIDSIQILDAELRKRCLDLFGQFQNNGQPERNDTVVSEAMRILEDRLRTILRCDVGMTARQLSVMAFNPDKPRLRVSAIRAEQEAAQLLFQGTFGFIRNQVQHKLIDDLPAERVLQILGWIDYLLAVINQSEQIASESTD
jgi:hypothetical protein